jgi:hypothetical protein
MSSGELDRAIAALREVQDGRSLSALRTEAKILSALETRQAPWLRFRWGVALATLCAVSSAWAATHPETMGAVRTWIASALSSSKETGGQTRAVSGTHFARRHGAASPEVASSHAVSSDAVRDAAAASAVTDTTGSTGDAAVGGALSTAESSSRQAKIATTGVRASAWASSLPGATPNSAVSRATSGAEMAQAASAAEEPPRPLEIYREASRLHLSGRDRAGALAAWERYLEVDPHGPLALEARYYRGVCLVDLGNVAEGKAALQPFAEGRYGSYRQSEARRILKSLGATAP